MLLIIVITTVLLAFAFLGIGIKMFFKKDGAFTKTCQSIDPLTGEKIGCVCNDTSGKKCVNKEK